MGLAQPKPCEQLIPEMLEEYGTHTRATLQHYLAPRDPTYLYDLIADYPSRGGRMLRPSLLIATARAFGSNDDAPLQTAAALELIHNAFLVHDDIEDASDERRGRPTLHKQHGTAAAINAGDGLFVMGFTALLGNCASVGAPTTLAIASEAATMAAKSVEGQAMEIEWRDQNVTNLHDQDYLELVLNKTCWYTTLFPLRAGYLLARRSSEGVDRLNNFGFFLGAAFQIQDDILNIRGDAQKYGKEINGDIWEGKRTLLLIHLLRDASMSDQEFVRSYLCRPRTQHSAKDVAKIANMMAHYGSVEYARCVAHALAGAAIHEISTLLTDIPDSRDKRFLEQLPTWVLERA